MIQKQNKKGGKWSGLLLLEVFLKDLTKRARKQHVTRHNVAIDETLYPKRGGILFKNYNKDKPRKSGINFRSLGS